MLFRKCQFYSLMCTLLAGLMASSSLWADQTARDAESDTGGWLTHWPVYFEKPASLFVLSLSVGAVLEQAGETQTFYLQPEIEKTYASAGGRHLLGSGELFIGMLGQLNTCLQGQLGLAVAATSNAELNGNIWEDANPAFDNYDYSYQINHSHVAIKGKILADFNQPVLLYVSGSLGVGFNNSHSFEITPKIYEELPAPLFESNIQTSFTYTLGTGIQRAITEHWQLGIGYEFADWGASQLGSAPGQTLNSGLHAAHLFTNALQCSLNFRG